jgi:hypothetical protein
MKIIMLPPSELSKKGFRIAEEIRKENKNKK